MLRQPIAVAASFSTEAQEAHLCKLEGTGLKLGPLVSERKSLTRKCSYDKDTNP